MFNPRGRRRRAALAARLGALVAWLACAGMFGCSEEPVHQAVTAAPLGWPPHEEYKVLPIRRAAAALALAGIESDADAVRVERVTSQRATEINDLSWAEKWTKDQHRLRSMWCSSMGDRRATASEADEPGLLGAAASYDPQSQTVFAVEGMDHVEQDEEVVLFTAVHELVHRWRDQESDMLEIFAATASSTEDWWITKLLLEGEAHFVTSKLFLELSDSSITPRDQWTLAEALLNGLSYGSPHLTYVAGAQWNDERFRAAGWPTVHRSFDDPLASIEQDLHREKRGDAPQVPLLPSDVESEGLFAELASDTLGELGFLDIFERQWTPGVTGRIAAAGWDGDLVSLIELPGGEEVLFARSTWDRESDAEHVMEIIERNSTGTARRRGCMIDWTSGDESLLNSEAFAAWGQRTDHWRPHPADAASTALAEARIVAEERASAYWSDTFGHFDFPTAGVRIEIEDGWLPMPLQGGWVIFKLFGDDNALVVDLVIEPPLPGSTQADLRERIHQRVAVHDFGTDSTRSFDVRMFGEVEAVTASSESADGVEHRTLALSTKDGVVLLLLTAAEAPDVDVDVEWDALLGHVKTGVLDDRTWNEEHKVFQEHLPDLELPPFPGDH